MEEKVLTGKKLHMSQIFRDNGKVVPVTFVAIDSAIEPEIEGKKVVITGWSKGKGFTGVMKKWNFSGQQATRGQSNKPRAAGAIGSQTPGRVFRGKKMAGRHGNAQVTIKGLKIASVDVGSNKLAVSGPIPGARNSKIVLRVLP